MKKILFVLISFTCLMQLSAQVKEGTLSYERKIDLWKKITDESKRASIPEFKITHHTLLFNDTVSLYKTIKEDDDQMNPFGGGEGGGRGFGGGGGGGRLSRLMGSADGDLYKNYAEGISVQALEQSGRNFLITDTIKKQPWKITEETKTILGYTCHKATMKQKGMGGGFGGFGGGNRNRRDGDNSTPDTMRKAPREVDIVAWFADKIYAPVGPADFAQLPGAILEVDVDNGFIVFTATDVKNIVASKDLKEPKKGKKVTREEFRNMLMELRKNFGSAAPDAGN